MENMNIDNNTIEKIKNLVNNGNISEAMSQISPDMIQQFSNMLNNNPNESNNQSSINSQTTSNNTNSNKDSSFNSNTSNNSSTQNNFDLNNIDMNTVMKLSSALGKMNNTKDDPRRNLLNSLKPYLRDSKKEKLDEYMKLLNVTKIAEVLNNNENSKNGHN